MGIFYMSNLKSNRRATITIGRSILDYIATHRWLFENRTPPLGERWTVQWEHFNSGWGCDIVRIENDCGEWMTLPKSVI